MARRILNLDEVVRAIKNADPDEVARWCSISRARKTQNGNPTYVCPECGNGTGKDGDGIAPKSFLDGVKWHCFKCGRNFSNIDWFARTYGLSTNGEDFIELCITAARDLSIPVTYDDELFEQYPTRKRLAPPPPSPPPVEIPKERKDYSRFLAKAEENLQGFLCTVDGVWRGLTEKTLQHYHCGFVKNFGSPPVEVVTIPSTQYSYMSRMVKKLEELPEDYRDLVKPKKYSPGLKDIFGFQNAVDAQYGEYIFVVEGAIDAMSGCQAIGEDKFISLNGSAISYYMETQFKTLDKGKFFIVMLDNDDAGRTQAQKVADKLIELGHYAIIDNISDKHKDINDFLQADPEGLKENLLQIYSNAKEKFDALKVELAKKAAEVRAFEDEETSNQKRDPNATTKMLIESCPIDLEVPPKFNFNRHGIEYEKSEKKKFMITSTPVVITKIFTATQNTVAKIEYAVYDRVRDSWSFNVTDTKTIADHRKIINLVDNNLSFVQDDAKYLSRYLMQMRDYGRNVVNIPKCKIYMQPGWTNNSCEDFVYPISSDNTYVVSGNNYDYKGGFETKGNVDDWVKMFNDICTISPIARLTIGAALAAPLLRVCDGRNFTLHLDCPSGNGKTAVIKFALSVFGNPEILNRTFNGTFNSYEGSFVALNDFPSGIDELQAANKNARENMTSLLYNFGEGKTRGRMNKDATNKPIFRYHGVLLTTAEQPLTGENTDMGAKRRTLEIPCRNILGEHHAKAVHELLNHHYGFFGREWINFIRENKADIKNSYTEVRKQLSNAFPNVMADYIFDLAISITAGFYFIAMLGKARIDKDTLKNFLCDIEYPEKINFIANLPSAQQLTNSARAINVVIEFLYSHPRHFKKATYTPGTQNSIVMSEEEMKPSPDGTAQEFYGIKLDDCGVLFYPTMLKKMLDDANFPNANAIIRAFAEEGFLYCGKDKGHLYQKQVRFEGNKRLWMYHFKEGVLTVDKKKEEPEENDFESTPYEGAMPF